MRSGQRWARALHARVGAVLQVRQQMVLEVQLASEGEKRRAEGRSVMTVLYALD